MYEENDAGGANPSYKGYDYQKLITIWVALDLMFGPNACTDQIVVEPASHDDVKARLDVPDDQADGSLTADALELHVQIKYKGAGYWSAKEFAAVIDDRKSKGTRGPSPRPRAKALLLKEPHRRYLFITNTSVDGTLAAGRVSCPSQRPDAAFLPTNLKLTSAEKTELAGRFGLIEHMSRAEARRQIDAHLGRYLKVPPQNLDKCVRRLMRLVEDRLLEVPDPLRRTEIEKIAEGLGGIPRADPQLAHFVEPSARQFADQRLKMQGAVLLVGPSGYGKSLTAESLVYERRNADPPYKVIRETEGLGSIDDSLNAAGPVLFYFEDPWGQAGLDNDDYQRWTNRIDRLLRQTSSSKQLIITSRTEVYRQAVEPLGSKLWAERTVVIDGRSYDAQAKQSMLYRRLEQAGAWRQDFARQHEAHLLATLLSPFEIDAFTRELIATDRPELADLRTLVDHALTDGRKRVVLEHARGFGDRGVRGSAVLWALLRNSRGEHPTRLRELRRTLDLGNSSPEMALDDLADHLAMSLLDRRDDGAYRAHSKVVEALEGLARSQPRAAENAINAAALAVSRLARRDRSWLDELLRLFDGARHLHEAGIQLSEHVVDAVDSFLTQSLLDSVDDGGQFRSAWDSARHRLSGKTPVGKLVDWLDRGAPRDRTGFGITWRAPKTTAADLNSVLELDPTLRVVRAFIAHYLPWTGDDYGADELVPWLKQFNVDLTEAFLQAGDEVAAVGRFVMSADAISEAALAWPSPPCERVWMQVLKMDRDADAALQESAEERRQAWQGELDYAHQLAVQEKVEEEGTSPSHFAKGYIRARRRQEGLGWISGHPRPDLILPLWAEVMNDRRKMVTPDELDAFFAASKGDDRLEAAGLKVVAEGRLEFGRARALTAVRAGGPIATEQAVRAIAWLEAGSDDRRDEARAEAVLLAMLPQLSTVRAAMLAPHVVALSSGKHREDAAKRAISAAAPASQAAVRLALALPSRTDDDTLLQQYRALAANDVENLLVEGPRPLARLVLMLASVEGVNITSIATTWLRSGDVEDARAALEALKAVRDPEAYVAVASALNHADFEVRRAAMQILAPAADAQQRRLILQMASDRSAPVRQALAEVIGQLGWTDGVDALLHLLSDKRDYTRHPEHQRRPETHFAVARAAAEALEALGVLPAEAFHTVFRFLSAGESSPTDVVLHARLLRLLPRAEGEAVWQLLERLLSDGRVVGGEGENLYPVRYAAGWCVLGRLQEHPQEIGAVPWSAIEAAADHLDPQLAAPALLALGFRLDLARDASTLGALRGSNASPVRAALALSMIDDWRRARDIGVQFALLPEDHPFFAFSDAGLTDSTPSDKWPLVQRTRDWLASIAEGTDVESVLLWVMSQRTGEPLGDHDFNPTVLRRKTTTPITSLPEMFGME